MPRSPSLVLLLSLSLFVVATVLLLVGAEIGSVRLMGVGIGALCLSGGGLTLGVALGFRRGNPLERRREQRLWKSGPLGRRWLEGRRRIP